MQWTRLRRSREQNHSARDEEKNSFVLNTPDQYQELRRAVIYGSVMGSFCCEKFGVDRFRNLTRAEIDGRYREFKAFTDF